MTAPSSISARLAVLQPRIEAARKQSPLAAPCVTLLAASKSQPESLIEEAINCNISHFGENRVQEAEDKWPKLLEKHPQVRLHLIGPLQSNKAKAAVSLFHVIQSVDRESLVHSLADAMEKTGKYPECYVQVNTGEEPQKAGVLPDKADALLEHCKNVGLTITGLMCVPPAQQPAAAHFALLREIGLRNNIHMLSMGMSEDFEAAIRMGSGCIRLGRSLFGERQN